MSINIDLKWISAVCKFLAQYLVIVIIENTICNDYDWRVAPRSPGLARLEVRHVTQVPTQNKSDTGPNTVQNKRKHKCNVCNETIWIYITITNPGWWLLSYDHRFAAVSQMNYFMKKLNYFQLRNYYKALVVSQKLANSLNNWVANSVGTKLTGSEWVVWQLWGSVVVALWYCRIVVLW